MEAEICDLLKHWPKLGWKHPSPCYNNLDLHHDFNKVIFLASHFSLLYAIQTPQKAGGESGVPETCNVFHILSFLLRM